MPPQQVLMISITIIIQMLPTTEAITELRVGPDCIDYSIHEVNNGETYDLIWNGETIPAFCKFGFSGISSQLLQSYEVCVEVINYDISSCNVKLNYYYGTHSRPDQSFSCNSHPTKICTELNFDIELTSTDGLQSYGNPQLKLRITGKYETWQTAIIAVAGASGGLAVIGIALVLIVFVRKRRKSIADSDTSNSTVRDYS